MTVPVALLVASTWFVRCARATPRRAVAPFALAAVPVLAGRLTPVPELVARLVVALLLTAQIREAPATVLRAGTGQEVGAGSSTSV